MPHVLIVDDDADAREMLETLLSHAGYSTDSARNGQEALERVRDRRPCLILLDLMMPVMTGWEFRRAQLQDPAIADVPVLCLTGAFDLDEVRQKLSLRCLRKPVDLDELQLLVDQTCANA